MKYKDIFNKDNETAVVFVTTKGKDDISINTVLEICMQLATKYDYYLDDTKTTSDYILLIYQKYDQTGEENENKKTGNLLEESRDISNLKIGKLVKTNLG